MESLFITANDEYVRDINPIKNYVNLSGYYLAKMTGDSIENTTEWIKDKLKRKDTEVLKRMPLVEYLHTPEGEDRKVEQCTLEHYMGYVIRSNRIMAGTGTVYKRVEEEMSLFTPFINDSRAYRSVFKKKMLECKRVGDSDGADFNNEQQNNAKIDVNTLSGSALQPTTIVHTESVHPTLTSAGRILTSIANALNERMVRGNRHYETPSTTLDDLVVLASSADRLHIGQCVMELGLAVPSVADIMEMVQESTGHYWRNSKQMQSIKAFVTTCDDAERCSMMYYCSLWDLINLNDELMLKLLNELSEPAQEPLPIDEAEKVLESTYGDLKTLAIYLCFEEMKGKSLYECRDNDHYTYGLVAATVNQIEDSLLHYQALFKAFFKLRTLPGNIYNIKSMYRKAVVTSDTDSTNFTAQEICKFVTGKYGLTPKDTKVAAFVTYMSSMLVCQCLGLASCNMGVGKEYIRELSMKNEFYTAVHCLTPSAKNYIMLSVAQEGVMLPELDLTTKGVELRSSKIPKAILDIFDTYKKKIFFAVHRGEDVYTKDVVSMPATLENEIIQSIGRGETDYLAYIFIKNPDAYSKEEDASQWKYHLVYEGIFGDAYGHMTEIPYEAVAVKVDLGNRTKLSKWVKNLKNPIVKASAEAYIKESGIDKITTFTFPKALFSSRNLPDEILEVIEVRQLAVYVMGPWYLLLEALGIYLKNKHNSRTISKVFADFIDPKLLEHKAEGA